MINKRIRMLQTRSGFHSPISPFSYRAGESYWVPSSIADQYLEQGIACEDKAIEVPETKVKVAKKRIFKNV